MDKYGPIYNDLSIKYQNNLNNIDNIDKFSKINIVKITNNEIFTNYKRNIIKKNIILIFIFFIFFIFLIFFYFF